MAIARSLVELDPEARPALKKAGLLTRDPRRKESKKYGLKKARKAPHVHQALVSLAVGQLRFGTDGVRGRVPEELDADYVTRLAFAAAQVLGPGPWYDREEQGVEQGARSAFRDGCAPVRQAGARRRRAHPALAAVARAIGSRRR
jgi:hypothetical protein